MNGLRFVISSSYGNDSIALIQFCYERSLRAWPKPHVTVLFHDTGWARRGWLDRVNAGEIWARSLGFEVSRTTSVGMYELVKRKKAWPRQGMQFCTEHLKIEPAISWLDANDPYKQAVCLIGVRRAESVNRASFPQIIFDSKNHGGRITYAPMVDFSDEQRDEFVRRAGFDVLPHRSMECAPCINSNKADLRSLTEEEIAAVEKIEIELGIHGPLTPNGFVRGAMFRPSKKLGATGIREVVRWAHTDRGKYDPTEGGGNCDSGFCGR